VKHAFTAAGLVMVLGGLGHWAGVAVRASQGTLENPIPYLVLIGLAQVTPGALLVIAGRAHAAGERAGRAIAAIAAIVTVVYAAAVLPALGDSPLLFQIAPVVYALAAITLAALALRGSAPTVTGTRSPDRS
jgi:hypothetical protein